MGPAETFSNAVRAARLGDGWIDRESVLGPGLDNQERLARFKCPKQVVFGALPKTSTGKIQKGVLRDSARSA